MGIINDEISENITSQANFGKSTNIKTKWAKRLIEKDNFNIEDYPEGIVPKLWKNDNEMFNLSEKEAKKAVKNMIKFDEFLESYIQDIDNCEKNKDCHKDNLIKVISERIRIGKIRIKILEKKKIINDNLTEIKLSNIDFESKYKDFKPFPNDKKTLSTIKPEVALALHNLQRQDFEYGGGYNEGLTHKIGDEKKKQPDKIVMRRGKKGSVYDDNTTDLGIHTHPDDYDNEEVKEGIEGHRKKAYNKIEKLKKITKKKVTKDKLTQFQQDLYSDSDSLFSIHDIKGMQIDKQPSALVSKKGIFVAIPDSDLPSKLRFLKAKDEYHHTALENISAKQIKLGNRDFSSVNEVERQMNLYFDTLIQNARKVYSKEGFRSKFFKKGEKVKFIQTTDKDTRLINHAKTFDESKFTYLKPKKKSNK